VFWNVLERYQGIVIGDVGLAFGEQFPDHERGRFARVADVRLQGEGSYLRLIDFVYHSTPGLRVIKKKRRTRSFRACRRCSAAEGGGGGRITEANKKASF